eukprot:4057709-Pleurochrysis_carterae.AAC.1
MSLRQAACFRTVSQPHAVQRRLGLSLSVLANTKAGDRFGDLAVNREQLSTRHAFTLHACFVAIHTVRGASAVREPPPALHFAYYSLDARPDCVVHSKATPSHHHELFEVKVASSIAIGHGCACACSRLSLRFGKTEPRLLQTILGCPPDGDGLGQSTMTLFVA